MNYNLILTAYCAPLWTTCLWFIARRLTKGITSSAHPALIGFLFLFASGIFYLNAVSGSPYMFAHFFFFSALVVTMFTDATTLLISRMVTLYAMPIGWVLSNASLIALTPFESILGSVTGLLLLTLIRTVSRKLMGKDGLGQGDIDLLCLIGAFTGPIGCWITLMTGSIIGSIIGLCHVIAGRGNTTVMLPFGLFLGMGASLYVLFQNQLSSIFLPL